MISGASTVAEPHPAVEPDVTAKMNKMRAATQRRRQRRPSLDMVQARRLPVRMDTPIRSSCFHRRDRGSSIPRIGEGARNKHKAPMGMANMATNQNTHDQLANCTKMAPIMRPRTASYDRY